MNKKKKSILKKMVLVVCMIVGLSAFIDTNAKADKMSWQDIKEGIENGQQLFTELEGEVIVDSPITIKNGKKIQLGGKATFKRADNYEGEFFNIQNGSLKIEGDINDRLKFDGSGNIVDDSRFAYVGKNGKFTIGNQVDVENFQTSRHGNIVKNDGYLAVNSTLINGEKNSHDDIYQNGTMIMEYGFKDFQVDIPDDLKLHIYINKPGKTKIASDFFVKNTLRLSVSDNIKLNDQLINVKEGINQVKDKSNGFQDYFTRKQKDVFKMGNGFLSNDYLQINNNGIYLKSNITTTKKTATYSGSPIVAYAPSNLAKELSNNIKYTYYTDKSLKNKTTAANGSKSDGGAPSYVGTYYAVSSIQEKNSNKWWERGVSELVIIQAKSDIAVNNRIVSMIEKGKANIAITKNFGKLSYKISSSKPSVVQVDKSNGGAVCKALKCGVSTITIATEGNKNISSGSVTVTVKVAPAKIKIKKAKSLEKKKMFIQWKVNKNATGYDIQYARDSKFTKKAKTLSVLRSKAKNGKGTAKKLKSNTTYYVRIRAYYKASKGEKIAGPWSKKKKVTIK